jgi:hypothetical protein
MYLITFIQKNFHSHFTINLLKFITLFLVKQLTMYKDKKKSKLIFEKFAFYGQDMELEPEPEPEP